MPRGGGKETKDKRSKSVKSLLSLIIIFIRVCLLEEVNVICQEQEVAVQTDKNRKYTQVILRFKDLLMFL